LDYGEEVSGWLDPKYVCLIVFLVDATTWKGQFIDETLMNFW